MGNPNPFEWSGTGLDTNMSRSRFIGLWLVAFFAWTAAEVLWQWAALPQTYDEIMKAIEEWKLTYAQLLEIGKRSGANFTDDQRKVLSGELAKLKMKEEKPVVKSTKPPLNETREDREKRLAQEKLEKTKWELLAHLNKNFFKSDSWSFAGTGHVPGKMHVDKKWVNATFTANESPQTSDLMLSSPIVWGHYNINLNYIGWAVGLWLYDMAWQKIGARVFLTNWLNVVEIPNEVATMKLWLITSKSSPSISVDKFEMSILKK